MYIMCANASNNASSYTHISWYAESTRWALKSTNHVRSQHTLKNPMYKFVSTTKQYTYNFDVINISDNICIYKNLHSDVVINISTQTYFLNDYELESYV